MYQVRFIEAERAVNYAGKGASVPGNYNGSLAYTADAASLVFRNLGSSAVNITGVIATNPYGTSVAAGAVVTQNTVVESGSIYAGVPAKKVKDISTDLIHGEIDRIANNYIKYASWFEEYNDTTK